MSGAGAHQHAAEDQEVAANASEDEPTLEECGKCSPRLYARGCAFGALHDSACAPQRGNALREDRDVWRGH